MATPTNYSANLTFGAKVDSSLDKAVQQIQTQLKSIQKDASLFSENIAVTQNQPLRVEIKGCKTGRYLLPAIPETAERLLRVQRHTLSKRSLPRPQRRPLQRIYVKLRMEMPRNVGLMSIPPQRLRSTRIGLGIPAQGWERDIRGK